MQYTNTLFGLLLTFLISGHILAMGNSSKEPKPLSIFDLPAEELYESMQDHEKGQQLLEAECKHNLAQRLKEYKKKLEINNQAKDVPVYASYPELVPNELARPYLWSTYDHRNFEAVWNHVRACHEENDTLNGAQDFEFRLFAKYAADSVYSVYTKIIDSFNNNIAGLIVHDYINKKSPFFLAINHPFLQNSYYPSSCKVVFENVLNHELTHCEQFADVKIINEFSRNIHKTPASTEFTEDLYRASCKIGSQLMNGIPCYLDMLDQDKQGNFYLNPHNKPCFSNRPKLLIEAEADIVALQRSTNPYKLKTLYKIFMSYDRDKNYPSNKTLYEYAKKQCKIFYKDKPDLYTQHKRETKASPGYQIIQQRKFMQRWRAIETTFEKRRTLDDMNY